MASRNPVSGGAIIALCIFTGSAIGATRGASSYGFLLGAGIGGLIALLIWLVDRARG